ncbi:hypothetical protein K3495_g3189 [Podosphaera aphanis]|nr:hypothetical protein K3495_g3189 [Podosphaera aphanis]
MQSNITNVLGWQIRSLHHHAVPAVNAQYARCIFEIAKKSRNRIVTNARNQSINQSLMCSKRNYWRKQVDNATIDAQVFKVMRWAKPRARQNALPLKVSEEKWLTDPLERAESLRDSLLTRFNAAQDLDTWETGQNESIMWNASLTLEDVTKNTLSIGDKSPGSDRITVRLLRACWEAIGEQVRCLFQAYLEHRYFPFAFRVAEVILLPKPARDLSTAKG